MNIDNDDGLDVNNNNKQQRKKNKLDSKKNQTSKIKDLQTKSRNKNKVLKDIDPELARIIKKYPINFSSLTHNKIYVSLNNQNKIEGARRDCEIDECYREIKYKLNEDMRYFGSILLGMVNKYVTDYADKAKQSNHLGQIEEVFEVLKIFGYSLGFYKDGVIPLVLKNLNPQLLLEQELDNNNNIKTKILE